MRIEAPVARDCGWPASVCRNNVRAMRRTTADLLVCLLIQILVLTGIGGAAHSGAMAAAERYALCGTGGAIDAPDGQGELHCLDCVGAVAEIAAGEPSICPDRLQVASNDVEFVRQVAKDSRAGALHIRAPPEVSTIDI